MGAPTAYPLTWPTGRPRTPPAQRTDGKFSTRGYEAGRGYQTTKAITLAQAIQRVEAEVERLGGRYPLLSTDIRVGLRGQPLSGEKWSDPGVALYFTLGARPYALACDRYARPEANIAAIAAHIDAMRAMTRHGVATAAESLQAFEALPCPPTPWELLGIAPGAARDAVEAAYRAKAKEAHPDRPGGSHDRMARLSDARDRALKDAAP